MAKTDADKMRSGKQPPGVFMVMVYSVTAESGQVQSQCVAAAAACGSPWQQMMRSPGCLSLLRSCTLIFHCKHTKNTCEHNPSTLLWHSVHNSSASHHMIQVLIPTFQQVSPKTWLWLHVHPHPKFISINCFACSTSLHHHHEEMDRKMFYLMSRIVSSHMT